MSVPRQSSSRLWCQYNSDTGLFDVTWPEFLNEPLGSAASDSGVWVADRCGVYVYDSALPISGVFKRT